MTRLPDLERTLIDAAERLDRDEAAATAGAEAPHGARQRRGMRERWGRMTRRGHVAGVLVGGLVLGAVATGSAQVAGLNPFGFDLQGKTDPALDPVGSISVSSVPDVDTPWRVTAWVARNGKVCVTGGPTGHEPEGQRSEFILYCDTSDKAAQAVLDTRLTGRTTTGILQLGAPSLRPRRLLAFAVTAADAPGVKFRTDRPMQLRVGTSDAPLLVPVEHGTAGLSPAGARYLATLPAQVELRLTVAEIASDTPIVTDGAVAAIEESGQPRTQPAQILVTSRTVWERRHGRPSTARRDNLLSRDPQPVDHQTPRQERTFPVLTRPRTAQDEIPAANITDTLRNGRIQRRLGHRLRVTGEGDVGPIWIAPGALMPETTSAQIDGQVCLAGLAYLSSCLPTIADGRRPDIEAVLCAPGLPRSQFLAWAFVPAQATGARVTYADGSAHTFATGDLLALMRPRTAPLVTRVDWFGPNGFAKSERGPFPADATSKICGKGQSRYWELRRSGSGSGETHIG